MKSTKGLSAQPHEAECFDLETPQPSKDRSLPDHTSSNALWLEARDKPRIRTNELPPISGENARVAARYGAISRGTERLVSAGEVPPSEFDRMRAPFQSGDFPFPVSYGYSVAGVVEDGPEGWIGSRVFCLHPHQDHFVVPVEALRPVPETVPLERAVLAANMETAVNVVWDGQIQPGDRVAIVGAGVVGLLAAFVAAAIPGTLTYLIDHDPSKADVAAALGLIFSGPESAPEDCDVVIHATGSEGGLVTAIDAAGFEGRIVEASWYGTRAATVPLGAAFHSRRLQIVSSQVGQVSPSRRARWSRSRRLDLALSLLEDPRLDVLISGETPFAALADTYLDILMDPKVLCHRIKY
ncbi:putative dehydrogenase [Fulvimarina pelagi HTCC2506]|uniref:Putative dehydrogenase n=1 Tax=Fulvimarina pelagi HTCC2506 TaxID=314231 RepID=Q0G7E2_9HYPH|nr:putative dehydrogenase [Fulvimarina pelagi HTCC2506]